MKTHFFKSYLLSCLLATSFFIGSFSLPSIAALTPSLGFGDGGIQVAPLSFDPATTDQLDELITNLNSMSGTLSHTNDVVSSLSGNMHSIKGSIATLNSNILSIHEDWTKTNSLISRILDPTFVFTSAMAAGAGASIGYGLGSLAVKAAISGTTKLVKMIKEALTHKKRDEELLNRFNAAREAYVKVKEASRLTEAKMDAFLYLALWDSLLYMKSSQNHEYRPFELLDEKLEYDMDFFSTQASLVKKAFKDLNLYSFENKEGHLDLNYLSKLSQELRRNKKYLKQMKKLKKTLDENRKDGEFCRELNDEFIILVEAERNLQILRASMLSPKAISAWLESEYKKEGKMLKETSSYEKDLKMIEKTHRKWALKNYKIAIENDPQIKKLSTKAWNLCMKDQCQNILEYLSPQKRSFCNRAIISPDSHYTDGYRNFLANIEDTYKRRTYGLEKKMEAIKGNYSFLGVNTEVNREALTEVESFLENDLVKDETLYQTTDRLAVLKEKKKQIKSVCDFLLKKGL